MKQQTLPILQRGQSTTKLVALLLLLLAYGLLYPGITQPVLDLTGVIDRAKLANIGKDIIIEDPQTPEMIAVMAEVLVENLEITGTVEAYHRERSILGTIRELYQSEYLLVAFLVGLFSIVVPLTKGLLMLFGSFGSSGPTRQTIQRMNSAISKWAMADVFVIGVFVAFLAANAVEEENGLLTFHAELGSGFYYFLSYCLLSIIAGQLLTRTTELADY